MRHHAPLTDSLAVRPEILTFTLALLEVRCPTCRKRFSFELPRYQPRGEDYCPECLTPWRWR